MYVCKPRPKHLLSATGAFPCLSKGDRNIGLESLDDCVDAEGSVRAEFLLPFVGVLNHPKWQAALGVYAMGIAQIPLQGLSFWNRALCRRLV